MIFEPITIVFFWFLFIPVAVAFSIMAVLTPFRYVFSKIVQFVTGGRSLSRV